MKKGVKFLIVLLFLIIIGLVTFIVVDKTLLSKDEDEEEDTKKNVVVENRIENTIENKQNSSSKEVNTKEENKTTAGKTYSDIQGTYQSEKIDLNAGSNLAPYEVVYTLVFNKDGSFAAYYENGDTDCHYVGYYTIENNKLTLHSVVFTGNDPSASLCNEVLDFTVNSDGTILDKKNLKFTKTSSTPREDTNIAKVINKYMAGCTTSGKDGNGPWFSGLDNN